MPAISTSSAGLCARRRDRGSRWHPAQWALGQDPGSGGVTRQRARPLEHSDRARQVIVKVRIVQHAQVRPASIKENLDSIERDGVQPDGSPDRLETARQEKIDAESSACRIQPDRYHFTIIVSPENGAQTSDFKSYTREFMAQVERDLGTRLAAA